MGMTFNSWGVEANNAESRASAPSGQKPAIILETAVGRGPARARPRTQPCAPISKMTMTSRPKTKPMAP
jgi:hypothetical protein